MDALLRGEFDHLARVIHEHYRRYHPGEEMAVDWDLLGEEGREANRRQADHIRVKLRAAGCTVWEGSPLRLGPEERGRLDVKLDVKLEPLARMEHNRWSASKRLDGFTHGEQTDGARKRHRCLVPWAELSEEDREKDRDTVRNIPILLDADLAGVLPSGSSVRRGERA